MKTIYFFFSASSLCISVYAMAKTIPLVSEFNDAIIVALYSILLLLSVLGIALNYDCFSTKGFRFVQDKRKMIRKAA